jgi:hypothetical protein
LLDRKPDDQRLHFNAERPPTNRNSTKRLPKVSAPHCNRPTSNYSSNLTITWAIPCTSKGKSSPKRHKRSPPGSRRLKHMRAR